MRVVAIATHYLGPSEPPGKQCHRAVSIQEHKEKVLGITSVDKRIHNDLLFSRLPGVFSGKLSIGLCLSGLLRPRTRLF